MVGVVTSSLLRGDDLLVGTGGPGLPSLLVGYLSDTRIEAPPFGEGRSQGVVSAGRDPVAPSPSPSVTPIVL